MIPGVLDSLALIAWCAVVATTITAAWILGIFFDDGDGI